MTATNQPDRPPVPGIIPEPVHLRSDVASPSAASIMGSMVRVAVEAWGTASFENDLAGDWFLLVEEAVEPGAVIASALDDALGDAEYLGLDAACEAIAAAELSASCAGHAPDRLPDGVRRWVDGHPHWPHDSEIGHAILAVERVRAESALRDLWDEDADGRADRWLGEIDDLIARLRHSGAGDPATLAP
jgi:Domain of unknown function (DUF4259)